MTLKKAGIVIYFAYRYISRTENIALFTVGTK